MNTTRPPIYIIILAGVATLLLLAGIIGGPMSLGRYSSPATIATAISGSISGTILACATAWMSEILDAIRRR